MNCSHNWVNDVPVLGSGLGFRNELRKEILKAADKIDYVEIITEQYTRTPQSLKSLAEITEVFQIIPHGIGLSIGSVMQLDKDYLRAIKRVSDLVKSPYYSEHLCMTCVPGIDIGHLSPLWFTDEVLKATIKKVNHVQDFLAKPLILENVTYLINIPNGTMSQTEFFHRLVEATGCGILLDITNIYVNSVNHNYNPIDFLDRMPLSKVVQVHIAGGYWRRGILVDGHSEPVQNESWELLKALAEKTQVKGVILEHDSNFPSMNVLLTQIDKARRIISQKQPY